jgi:hypothetical protein
MVRPAEIPRPARRIRRALPWLVALALALVVPLFGAGPSPAAASSSMTVGASTEAWYAGPGTQSSPVALAPVAGLPAANPYRAGTLHVGLAGGNETARTYLRLDTGGLGDGALQQATLVLPVDPSDGSLTPETAPLTVCFAPDPGPSVDGSLSTPPPVDCSASTPARYEAAPAPRFVADLADLGIEPAVRTGGIAVLPAPASVAARDTWHVAFYTAQTAPTPADAIHCDLVVADAEATAVAPPSAEGTTDVAATDLTSVADDLEPAPSFADTPLARLELPETGEPPALLAGPPPAARTFIPAAATDTPASDGFAYSIVLVLPLVLIAAFGALASSLSRPPVVVTTVVEDHKRA